MSKEFICIVCPRGCHLSVSDDLVVTGNSCPRGEKYGKQEAQNPTRVLTSTIKVEGSYWPRCSVKSEVAIPKGKLFEAMKEIDEVSVKAPVHIGDVIIEDLAGTGVRLLATRNMEKCE